MTAESKNADRLPLVPTDFSDVQEALHNFSVVFESRYGGFHPRFQAISLSSALNEAFGGTSKLPTIDQRPLAIYLHNDDAIACNIFAERVLCIEAIVSLLNCQFVLWPWDVTQSDNRAKLIEWLNENNLRDMKDSLKMMSTDDFPLLYIVTKDRAVYEMEMPIRGTDDVDKTMEKLLTSLDKFQEIKNRAMAEQQNRVDREQFRQEQVTAYEESLAIDRAKQEGAVRQRQKEMDYQVEEQRQQEAKDQRQAELASTLPLEPDASCGSAITIRLRFPDGDVKTRRFQMETPLGVLLQYIESVGYDIGGHRVFTSDLPRKDVTMLPTTQTFAQLGWTRREALTVHEK